MILRHSKQSLGTTAMCLSLGQITISTLLWGNGAVISDGLTKLSKREDYRDLNYQKLILSVLRMQDLNGIFTRHLMSASRTLWRSKQSLGTAMCLKHGQITISTVLWEDGAVISYSLTKLSKRDRKSCIIVNFQKLILSALRKLVLSGVSNKIT